MKNWTIVYRLASGAQAEMTLEAESRAAVFAELQRRGIAAVSVREGAAKRAKPAAVRGVRPQRSGNGAFMWMLVLVALALVAAVVLIVLLAGGEAPVAKPETRTELIETVAPQTTDVFQVKREEPLPPQRVGEIRNGYRLLPSGRLHKVRGVITNSTSATMYKGAYAIFDNRCENEIACLLTIKPGQTIVGTPHYNGRFRDQFLKSLETPIVINPDDSEEVAALKRAVRDAKVELKAAYDRGEDIEQLMLDARRENQELARYRQEIHQQLNEFRRLENVTDEDIEDFLGACNQMLEQKGIAPLKLTPITRQKLKMQKDTL